MQKFSYIFALLLSASMIFISCRDNDDNGTEPIGIGSPTATTDPGVLIGAVNGEPIRWATRNVNSTGTFVQYPHSMGRHFQWNRSHGWDTVCQNTPADWDSSSAPGDAWESENDPCPRGWRVPTIEEFRALDRAGFGNWVLLNGVRGRWFGAEPNRIFLPAAGQRSPAGGLPYVGEVGFYWTASPGTQPLRAWQFRVDRYRDRTGYTNNQHRFHGYSIRCVAE